MRSGGTDTGSGGGWGSGEDRSAGCHQAGAQLSLRRPDRGVGTRRGTRSTGNWCGPGRLPNRISCGRGIDWASSCCATAGAPQPGSRCGRKSTWTRSKSKCTLINRRRSYLDRYPLYLQKANNHESNIVQKQGLTGHSISGASHKIRSESQTPRPDTSRPSIVPPTCTPATASRTALIREYEDGQTRAAIPPCQTGLVACAMRRKPSCGRQCTVRLRLPRLAPHLQAR